MSTDNLVKEIEERDYILPKDILKQTSEDELVKQLEEIFSKHKKRIAEEPEFRRKYIELVNYVIILNLRKAKKEQKKSLFDKDLIQYLLSSTQTA